MYIGSTGLRGLHHLVYEVVDNSVDEALQGHCDHITVTIAPDARVTVTDNGRGIPVAVMEGVGLPAAEVVLTKLHAGGKFGGAGYKVSGGLHGVGISVVNALSESLDLEIRRDGHVWRQSYERGDPTGPLTMGDPTEDTGTIITFLPDGDIFEETDYSFETHRAADARDGVSDARPPDRAHRRARRRRAGRLPVRGWDQRLHRPREQRQGARAQGRRLLRQRDRRGRGRGRDAVERLVRRVHVLVRQQHQHPRGRYAPLGLQVVAHADAERLRPRQGAPQGEGGGPHRRRLPRGACGHRLGEAARAAVRGADQDQAREPLDAGSRRDGLQRQALRVPRGASARGAGDREQAHRRQPGAPGRPQGARPDPAQDRARRRRPAGQAGRLHRARPARGRALPRRGRLGRGQRRGCPRPPVPGDPAAARQDHQRREGAHQQGALEQRDPGDDHRDRHRHR